jgi:ubiquinone/menaquinone biosynthesis C-methylase UbiE
MTRRFDIKKWLAEHPEEEKFKHQVLDKNPSKVLFELGIKAWNSVLDFGCGSGTYTIPAAKLVGNEGKIYAFDINRTTLDRMEGKAKREGLTNIVRVDASGGENLPFEDGSMDVVLLIDVLKDIDDRKRLFHEVHRILKPNGIVTVYPMHLSREAVEQLARDGGLKLEDRKFQERILIFRKTPEA